MLEKFDHVVIINNFNNSNSTFKSWDSFKKTVTDTFYTYMKRRLVLIECLDLFENYKCYAIGLILNPEMLRINIEQGSVYGSQEAIEFKKLWGDMSTLRQLNGSVYECVIWPKDGNLTLKIVNFLMREKLGFPAHGDKGGWHQIYSEQFNKYINPIPYLTNKKKVTINDVFDSLSSLLSASTASKTIKKLPVHINDLRPIGSWYKGTNLFPEKFITINGFNKNASIEQINNVFHVAFIIEANNKWPSDFDALQIMKKLFLARLSKLLWSDRKVVSKVLKNCKLDIVLNGFVFRCFLVIQKECLMLKRQTVDTEFRKTNNTKKRKLEPVSNVDNRLCDMSTPLKQYLLKHDLIMDISSRIRCFSAQFGGAFVDTCRLVKRWLTCQYIDLVADDDERLSGSYLTVDDSQSDSSLGWCLSEVAVELIVSNLFIHPNSEFNSYPESAVCGFLRFLKFMSEFNWTLKPLVVNFNNDYSPEEMKDLSEPFLETGYRFTRLPMMVIRTPVNRHGDHWTTVGPNIEMLARLQELSKKAYYCAEHLLLSASDYKPVFTVDISRFGVLFHLKQSILNLYLDENIDVTKSELKDFIRNKNKRTTTTGRDFRVWPKEYNDNPVEEFVICIRRIIEGNAVCSVNKFGGKFIALEWLRNDVDKNFIIKSICNKGLNFISKCEILK